MEDFELSYGIEFRRRFVDLGLVSSRHQMQTLVLDTFRLEVSRQLCEEWLKGPGAVSVLAPSRGCTVLYDRYRDKLLRWHFVVQGMFPFVFCCSSVSFHVVSLTPRLRIALFLSVQLETKALHVFLHRGDSITPKAFTIQLLVGGHNMEIQSRPEAMLKLFETHMMAGRAFSKRPKSNKNPIRDIK